MIASDGLLLVKSESVQLARNETRQGKLRYPAPLVRSSGAQPQSLARPVWVFGSFRLIASSPHEPRLISPSQSVSTTRNPNTTNTTTTSSSGCVDPHLLHTSLSLLVATRWVRLFRHTSIHRLLHMKRGLSPAAEFDNRPTPLMV